MDAAKMVPVLFNLRTGAQTFFRRGGTHRAKRSVVTIPDWIKNATGNRFGNVVFPLRRQVCRSIRKLRTGPLVPYIFRHVRTEYGTADLSRDVKLLLFGVYAVLSLPTTVLAQSYPTRAITLVVPYAAGTGVDGLGRALASHLGKGLGQPVVVENRPGAGTNIGTGYVARSKPDGYTLVLAANSGLAANKSLYSQLGYDPQADLAPVAFLGKGAMVILATPASNVRTMAQLVEHAKTDPSKINFGAANTTARVWIELIKSAAGIQGQTILYTNAGVMLNDMLGGQISFSVENTGTSRALVSSGKLLPLAVTSKNRAKFNASVPTLAELGITDVEVDTWYAVYAPKGTPPPIVGRLNKEINALQQNEDYLRAMDFVEYTGGGGTPEQLGAFQASEINKWRDLVNRTGIRLD